MIMSSFPCKLKESQEQSSTIESTSNGWKPEGTAICNDLEVSVCAS